MNPEGSDLVVVEWVDIIAGNEWEESDDLDKWKPSKCWSCGWLILDEKEYIILLTDHSEPIHPHKGDKPGYGGHRVIPKGVIRKITKMKEARNGRSKTVV